MNKSASSARGFVAGDQKICPICLLNYKFYHANFLEHATTAE